MIITYALIALFFFYLFLLWYTHRAVQSVAYGTANWLQRWWAPRQKGVWRWSGYLMILAIVLYFVVQTYWIAKGV
jgi:uncharacterized membrane protein